GEIHAEELALLKLATDRSAGGTAYVTLEPCHRRSHGGLSCSERLIKAGIARVVVSVRDEHPQGRGGIDRLKRAGVTVETGVMEEIGAKLYADFFAQHEKEF
ncbi:MAG: riboflavin biosynthesis protein RibD, partial [Pseudomonadota bacterium]